MTEIPPVKTEVTEHQMIEMECPCCGERTKADAPDGITAPVQYGSRRWARTCGMAVHVQGPGGPGACEMFGCAPAPTAVAAMAKKIAGFISRPWTRSSRRWPPRKWRTPTRRGSGHPEPAGATAGLRKKGPADVDGCKGTGSVDIALIGTAAWIRPDAAFWRMQAGIEGTQLSAAAASRYLKGSTAGSTLSSLAGIYEVRSLAVGMIVPDPAEGVVTTAGGQQSIPIISTSKGTLYVTGTSVPQILRQVTTKKGDTGTADFSYGPVTLTAPPVSQSVSGPRFGL